MKYYWHLYDKPSGRKQYMDINTDQTYHRRDRICDRSYRVLYVNPSNRLSPNSISRPRLGRQTSGSSRVAWSIHIVGHKDTSKEFRDPQTKILTRKLL